MEFISSLERLTHPCPKVYPPNLFLKYRLLLRSDSSIVNQILTIFEFPVLSLNLSANIRRLLKQHMSCHYSRFLVLVIVDYRTFRTTVTPSPLAILVRAVVIWLKYCRNGVKQRCETKSVDRLYRTKRWNIAVSSKESRSVLFFVLKISIKSE